MAALIEARRRGAKMAEFDVRLTHDRIPVLFHDDTFKGPEEILTMVNHVTLEQLRAHCAVNTLEEVLLSDAVTEFLNIEIKSNLILSDPLERTVSELIDKLERRKSRIISNRVMFSSFNPISIFKLAGLLPQIPRGFLATQEVNAVYLREMWTSVWSNFHVLHLDQDMISSKNMQVWNDHGVKVASWTVNNPDRMKELLDWGVVSLISDEVPPQELLS